MTRPFQQILMTLPAPLMLAAACARGQAPGGPPAGMQGRPAMPVKVAVVRAVPIEDTSDYIATLKSRHSAAINPQVEGQVTRIDVRSGERVAAGAPLMQIDPLKQQATLRSQEDTRAAKVAAVKFAEQQLARIKQLAADGVVSKQDLDQAQTALESAQAELQALDAQVREQQVELRYYRVLAPTSGIVGDIPVRVGDRVTQSTVLTTIDQPGDLELYVDVPVERAPELAPGKPVQVVDSQGAAIATSRIDFISPRVSGETQSVLIKSRIANPDSRLRTSQFARARIVWSARPGPVVPVLAVSRLGGQFFVFVAEAQGNGLVARQRQIQVGEIRGNDYVVLKGLAPGDRLIVGGTQMLADGAPVVAQP